MENKLLPIGTVVSLKGAKKKLMIIGCGLSREDDPTEYDYIGLPFPDGYIDADTMFLFFAKDINRVHYFGFVDAEMQDYLTQYANHLGGKDTK